MGKSRSRTLKEYHKWIDSVARRLDITHAQARTQVKRNVGMGNALRKKRHVAQNYSWRTLRKSMGRKHRLPDVYKEEYIDYEEDEYFEYL